MRRLIQNGTVINEGTIQKCDILIDGNTIIEIGHNIPTDGCELIDATDCYVIPGVIDDQVHFREPGLTHKGNIKEGSRAAAAGGVTSFMDMPNVKPATTHPLATNEICGMLDMIGTLIEKGHAYPTEKGDVYFSVKTFKKVDFPRPFPPITPSRSPFKSLKSICLSFLMEYLNKILIVVSSLSKWNGHLYNWYNIKTLMPLMPRYISTVDSGNFVGYLYIVKSFLNENKYRGNFDYLIEIVEKLIKETDFSKLYNKKIKLFSAILERVAVKIQLRLQPPVLWWNMVCTTKYFIVLA